MKKLNSFRLSFAEVAALAILVTIMTVCATAQQLPPTYDTAFVNVPLDSLKKKPKPIVLDLTHPELPVITYTIQDKEDAEDRALNVATKLLKLKRGKENTQSEPFSVAIRNQQTNKLEYHTFVIFWHGKKKHYSVTKNGVNCSQTFTGINRIRELIVHLIEYDMKGLPAPTFVPES